MPAENQTPAPRKSTAPKGGTTDKGGTTTRASGGTNGQSTQTAPAPASDPGAQKRAQAEEVNPTAAAGPEELDDVLRIVRSVGKALLLIGNVTKHEPPMDGVLRALYIVVQEGEHAFDKVQKGGGKTETPPKSVPPVSALPAWPEAGAKDAPNTLEAVWGVLEPWLGELVERLPGSSDRQIAVKLWVTNCLPRWKELVGGISDALKHASTAQETQTSP